MEAFNLNKNVKLSQERVTSENHVVPIHGSFNSDLKACLSLSWIQQLPRTYKINVMCSLRWHQLKKSEKHKPVLEKVTTLRNRNLPLLMHPEGFKNNLKIHLNM